MARSGERGAVSRVRCLTRRRELLRRQVAEARVGQHLFVVDAPDLDDPASSGPRGLEPLR